MAATIRRKKKKDHRQTAFTRFMIIIAFFVLWIGGIGARLVYLQVNQHDELRQKAVGQRRDVKQTKLLRGTIYDRNERALAMSVKAKTLYADPMRMDDINAAAKDLAKILKKSEKELREQLADAKEAERRFVPLEKGLDTARSDEINKALDRSGVRKSDLPNYPGLHWRDEQRRSYPHGTLAAHVIGFSDAAGVGQAGIEQAQNVALYGAVIKRQQERDRLGRVYDEVVTEKEPPKDVILTIDNTTQYFVEQALEKAVKQSNAKSGMVVVLSNKTGEVLAMANYPTFDPNDLSTITSDNLRNSSIQSMYSPGSVFKLITYSAAIERKLARPDAEIEAGNGTINVGKRVFKDSRALGRITYTKAMAVSSNVCAIKTSMKVGREGFYQTVRDFGFGEPTGVGLPAETSGVVRSPDKWFGDSLASMSIGYEIGVSALQMATAFATIANDGVKIQPHVIKEIRQSDETTVSVTRPEKKRVVSVETARQLRTMLREVVVSGTGKKARIEGYSSAGKTGTAWKFDEALKRVNSAKYISSFIGFAPANDPEVTIAVVMDEPKVGGRDGGSVAAPVFKEIAEQVLPHLKIKPGSDDGNFREPQEEEPEFDLVEIVGNGEEISPFGKTENAEEIADNSSEEKPKGGEKLAVREPKREEKKEKVPQKPAAKDNGATGPRPVPKAAKQEPAGTTRKRIETKQRN